MGAQTKKKSMETDFYLIALWRFLCTALVTRSNRKKIGQEIRAGPQCSFFYHSEETAVCQVFWQKSLQVWQHVQMLLEGAKVLQIEKSVIQYKLSDHFIR